MESKLRGLLSIPALRVFCLCGAVSVLADADHLITDPPTRALHGVWLVASLVGGCYGVGLLSIGREAWVILLIEFTRRVRDALRLFLDEPITPNTQSATVKVSENDN